MTLGKLRVDCNFPIHKREKIFVGFVDELLPLTTLKKLYLLDRTFVKKEDLENFETVAQPMHYSAKSGLAHFCATKLPKSTDKHLNM